MIRSSGNPKCESTVICAALAIAFVAIAFGSGFVFGVDGAGVKWRTECIKRGVAEYDSVTGEWRWKITADEHFQAKDGR